MTDKFRNLTCINVHTATYGQTGRNPHVKVAYKPYEGFCLVVALVILTIAVLIMAWGFGLWTLP